MNTDSNLRAFDVWRNHSRKWTATPALGQFAEDTPPPYGFNFHEVRIMATDPRDAINRAKRENREDGRK